MTASEALVHRLERTFRAPRPVVWRALTDPAQLGTWWGPQGFIARSVELDARVGGEYRIAMQPPDGDAFFLSSEFLQAEPPTRLAYTSTVGPTAPR